MRGVQEWKCTARQDGETCGLVSRVNTCSNGHAKTGREQWLHRLETEPDDFLAEIMDWVKQRYGDIGEDDLRALLKVQAFISV